MDAAHPSTPAHRPLGGLRHPRGQKGARPRLLLGTDHPAVGARRLTKGAMGSLGRVQRPTKKWPGGAAGGGGQRLREVRTGARPDGVIAESREGGVSRAAEFFARHARSYPMAVYMVRC